MKFRMKFFLSVLCLFIVYQYVDLAADSEHRNLNLPYGYEDWQGCRKQEYLWKEKIVSSVYTVNPEFKKIDVIGLAKTALTQKMSLHSDTVPNGWQKAIHAHGSVAKVSFTAEADSPFSGFFQGSPCGFIRLSVTGRPSDRGFAPGAAIKFFVDGRPSLNFSALYRLTGQGNNYNFFAHELSNIVPPERGIGPRLINGIFKRVSKYQRALYLKEFAELANDGTVVTAVRFPYRLYMVPTQETQFSSHRHDFRSDLAELRPKLKLYDIFAVVEENFSEELAELKVSEIASDEYRKRAVKIGSLHLESKFLASRFGDRDLFFRHQSYAVPGLKKMDDPPTTFLTSMEDAEHGKNNPEKNS